MKITIDTKEDSKEEIKRAIHLLSGLVGGGEFKRAEIDGIKPESDIFSSSYGGSDNSENSDNAFANMFGNGGSETETSEPSFDLSADLLDKPEEKQEDEEEIPKVVSY